MRKDLALQNSGPRSQPQSSRNHSWRGLGESWAGAREAFRFFSLRGETKAGRGVSCPAGRCAVCWTRVPFPCPARLSLQQPGPRPELPPRRLWSRAMGRPGLNSGCDGPVLSIPCGAPGPPTRSALLAGAYGATEPLEGDCGSTVGANGQSFGALLRRFTGFAGGALSPGPAAPTMWSVIVPSAWDSSPECPSFGATLLPPVHLAAARASPGI